MILGAKFIPLVLETYGNMGAAFSSFLGKLSMELFSRQLNSDADDQDYFKNRLRQMWVGRISICIQTANTWLIMSKISRTQQVSQRGAPRLAVDFSGAHNWSI